LPSLVSAEKSGATSLIRTAIVRLLSVFKV
jgi:hypothetical protein